MTDSPQKERQQLANSHRLRINKVELVGGGRQVFFGSGLNVIFGDITTGKTTLVRLIRGLLGVMPDGLAPETQRITGILGDVLLGDSNWRIYRPRAASRSAMIEIAEQIVTDRRPPVAMRLPAAGSGQNYSSFMLDQLSIPVVSVPQARTRPTDKLTPITMTDWLGYCIIAGDELDTQVFGHLHPFRNIKRRWVFELIYGYFDPELARLVATLGSIDLQLQALDQESTVLEKFLAETPFADSSALQLRLRDRQTELMLLRQKSSEIATSVAEVPGAQESRETLLALRGRRTDIGDRESRLQAQIADLRDLHRQLKSQSARITRAIVADEWLVDFDFVVCPRCGTDVDADRGTEATCYLCLQEHTTSVSRDQLLAEQDRIGSQILETEELIEKRSVTHKIIKDEMLSLDREIEEMAERLDRQTASFISDRATTLENLAAEQARLEADVARLNEYLALLRKFQNTSQRRSELEDSRDELSAEIESKELGKVDAEEHVRALEQRMLEYLHELHIPQFGDELSVKINRTTFLPIIAGRSFEELSSQGLKTLVNIAHALAHHTVAIDRDLPLPGFLIIDGISANSGSEGFDRARVADVYRLLKQVGEEYEDELQIIAVDNEPLKDLVLELLDSTVLVLRQNDRLIRTHKPESAV
ncbi:hypothetical protein [Actinomadura kijaniata]|uniref:hypothetical protein n=1 Tax=Actinomadura kijaniata TaxID=46161 RepID=UPI000AD90D1C|nr:hypothetical protein [Actinomadura kijaniata]